MATSLSAAFTAIANAIRAKKGVSTTYTPDEMPDAIASIATATLQTKTTNVTPSANWSGTNTNTVAITPDSGYDGMSQVNVSVPMLRDYTLMTADTVDTPSTVYSGNTSQSNSQKLLRMKPTKDGMSYTGSYLYMQPNSYLGNATASDVLSGKTFSSSNGIQITGTGSSGGSVSKITVCTWSDSTMNQYSQVFSQYNLKDYDYAKITYVCSIISGETTSSIFPIYIHPSSDWSSTYASVTWGAIRGQAMGDNVTYYDIFYRDVSLSAGPSWTGGSTGISVFINTAVSSSTTISSTGVLPRKLELIKLNNISS